MSAYVPPRGMTQWGWRSCAAPPTQRGRGEWTPANGGSLHSRFLRNEARSAIEAHWRNPHFVPVGVLVIGRWLRLPFRGPDELLIFQDADGLCAQKNGEIDCERRLSGSLRRGSKEKRIPY